MMSSRLKVCVAITARPSYSRIRTALDVLRQNSSIELVVLCSGSALLDRYGRVVDLIRSDGFCVAEELYTFVEGNEPINMALTVANTINQTAAALRRIAPDCVVTIADRYETLGTAIASAYLGLPLIHVQGGEITGNIDEKVRHSVTKLADVHLVANQRAAERLVRMGERPSSIAVTGCPSIDIARNAVGVELSAVQEELCRRGVGASIDLTSSYLVVLQHPETDTYSESYSQMRSTLDAVHRLELPTLVFWPNVDAGSDATSKCIRVFRESGKLKRVHYVKNLEGTLFLRLLLGAGCLIGNSSVGLRECAYMGVPVVNIGNRQRGRDRAKNVMDVDYDAEAIDSAVRRQLAHGRYFSSALYGDGRAGEEIARVIAELQARLPATEKHFYEAS
jgi:UDP-hydrolysing UDP-N-acetyl-D-glucosamine 2-epimerase